MRLVMNREPDTEDTEALAAVLSRLTINPARPIADAGIGGGDCWIITRRLGQIHCCSPIREALREARPVGIAEKDPALRRAWALLVMQIHERNLRLFAAVSSGRY